MRVLVVTNPFGGLSVGERITDQTKIDEILAGEHAHHVVQADHADGAAAQGSPQTVVAPGAAGPAYEDEHAEENTIQE